MRYRRSGPATPHKLYLTANITEFANVVIHVPLSPNIDTTRLHQYHCILSFSLTIRRGRCYMYCLFTIFVVTYTLYLLCCSIYLAMSFPQLHIRLHSREIFTATAVKVESFDHTFIVAYTLSISSTGFAELLVTIYRLCLVRLLEILHLLVRKLHVHGI